MTCQSLMILGTASGVGKSLITAGFCRIFSDAGYRVVPFKAQNMSNNSYVTAEGREIGRAQAVQAECARVMPHHDMNPILLKPSAEDGSQVIVHGLARGHCKARDYFGQRKEIEKAVQESYARLAKDYQVLVLEGAGSPAEMNLKKFDLVNMRSAEMADAQCLLVADIDRGGVFASLLGTLDLLTPKERDRIAGLVINKFRGDRSLFDDGVEFLEKRSGKKVLGVLPFDPDLWIMEEDSLTGRGKITDSAGPDQVEVAVIYLPFMSNFTDFEILRHEPGIHLRYVTQAEKLGHPDLLILPGTKSTLNDLREIQARGFESVIRNYFENGGVLLGVCGGFQMLGKTITDAQGLESHAAQTKGFGFFDMHTEFVPEKVLNRKSHKIEFVLDGLPVSGTVDVYEIHMGRSRWAESYQPFGDAGAVHSSGRILGTYDHGLFDHPDFRQSFFSALAKRSHKKWQPGASIVTTDLKEAHYQRLARLLRDHLDLPFLEKRMGLSLVSKLDQPVG